MSTKGNRLKLPADVHILFLGNSTIETSVDDNLIPHSFNFAKSAEHIEFAYAKLKMMKRINPQIDTVVVGIDDGILFSSDTKWGRHEINHPYYLTEFGIDDIITSLRYRGYEWNKNYLTSLYDTYKLLFIFTGKEPGRLDMGGYSHLVRDKLKEDVERLARERATDDPDASSTDRSVEKISPATLHFINKMISHLYSCLPQNIRPFGTDGFFRRYAGDISLMSGCMILLRLYIRIHATETRTISISVALKYFRASWQKVLKTCAQQ
ncbi:MAG: hypothetical protein Q4F07_06290 [Bacteroidales bacterium]|nr:hypothetical protein [Bacteroidales bacterium]